MADNTTTIPIGAEPITLDDLSGNPAKYTARYEGATLIVESTNDVGTITIKRTVVGSVLETAIGFVSTDGATKININRYFNKQ